MEAADAPGSQIAAGQRALQRVFADLEEEHRAFVGLVAGLPEDQAVQRPTAEWSAVDSLIHITSWKENGTGARNRRSSGHTTYTGTSRRP